MAKRKNKLKEKKAVKRTWNTLFVYPKMYSSPIYYETNTLEPQTKNLFTNPRPSDIQADTLHP